MRTKVETKRQPVAKSRARLLSLADRRWLMPIQNYPISSSLLDWKRQQAASNSYDGLPRHRVLSQVRQIEIRMDADLTGLRFRKSALIGFASYRLSCWLTNWPSSRWHLFVAAFASSLMRVR